MSAMIDQMPGPDNRDDRRSPSKRSEPEPAPENIGGSYYYDDATGYEVFRDEEDEEPSSDDDANQREDLN